MFRVRLDPKALAYKKQYRLWERKNNTHRLNQLNKQYPADTPIQRAIKNIELAKQGKRVGTKSGVKVSTRVGLLPRAVRDSWASEESIDEGTAPEVIQNLPLPDHLKIGHNNPPEPIETPEDDVLAEDTKPVIGLDIPEAALFLLTDKARYKAIRGGRGSGKSWAIARSLIFRAHQEKLLILCVREFQNSIADSVHRLISNQIELMGLSDWFDIQQNTIVSKLTGAEFIFKGMHRNIKEIKSTEGVDICWLEEAQSATEESLMILFPTIRGSHGKRSEIWISFNPQADDDPIYTRFGPEGKYLGRSNTIIREMNWDSNPWFPADLEEERQHMMLTDPDVYDHVWEGKTLKMSDATILRGKFRVEAFDTPEFVDRFFTGVDWGFSTDPCAVIRSFIKDKCLYIDYEAYGHNVDLENLHVLFDKIPTARRWPMKADNSRPETISYMSRQGFNITAAEKWPGSVEDGIAHLRGFDQIIIHPRCTHTAQEARLYSWKRDKKTNEVLPLVEDKHNHCWDAVRYSLDGYIQARGGIGVWLKLIQPA